MLLSIEKSRTSNQNDVLTDKTVYMKDYTLSRGKTGKLRTIPYPSIANRITDVFYSKSFKLSRSFASKT